MPNACAGCHGMSANVFYFGPNGIWWNTTAAHSGTAKSMSRDAKPGTVPAELEQDN